MSKVTSKSTITQLLDTDPEASLLVSPGPHIHVWLTTQWAMLLVIASLLPVSAVAVYLFGAPALWVIVTAVVAAMVTEAVCLAVRRRPIALLDGSAALTGLLLALCLPPRTPLWMTALGAAFAIGIGKHAFGGLGYNPFNPALVGRVFLAISFPLPLATYHLPFDTVTGATPLTVINASGTYGDMWSLFAGTTGGSLGETSAVALLIGGLILLVFRVIDWRIPVGMIGATAIVALIAGHDPMAHILSGGLLLGAFFMATDWVTSPLVKPGRWIFGIGIGVLTMLFRLLGSAPEGVSFAILWMNGLSPLINTMTRPRGSRSRKG